MAARRRRAGVARDVPAPDATRQPGRNAAPRPGDARRRGRHRRRGRQLRLGVPAAARISSGPGRLVFRVFLAIRRLVAQPDAARPSDRCARRGGRERNRRARRHRGAPATPPLPSGCRADGIRRAASSAARTSSPRERDTTSPTSVNARPRMAEREQDFSSTWRQAPCGRRSRSSAA